MTDLAIIGGGPAGLATAIHAALRGLSAVVIEKRTPPLDKACGEGVMPPGVAALSAMGVKIPESGYAPFHGIRYIDGNLVAAARFRTGSGWGIRRTALTDAMANRARALGVDLRYGCGANGWERSPEDVAVGTDSGTITARFLVGADGLHSRVRREAGLQQPDRGRRRFGVRRHFALPPWSACVEVYWADGAEAYITPCGRDRVGVAFLWEGNGRSFDDLLPSFPAVAERLAGASVASEARGAGPFEQRVRRRYADRVALVGDAAGYVDPITGEGLSLAFRSARALVETLASGARLEAYERAYRRVSRPYYLMTNILLAITRWPRLRRTAIKFLSRNPGLFAALLAMNCGERPLTSVSPFRIINVPTSAL